jgi:hypothetical protein
MAIIFYLPFLAAFFKLSIGARFAIALGVHHLIFIFSM